MRWRASIVLCMRCGLTAWLNLVQKIGHVLAWFEKYDQAAEDDPDEGGRPGGT